MSIEARHPDRRPVAVPVEREKSRWVRSQCAGPLAVFINQ